MRSRNSGCCAPARQGRWIFHLYDACGREVLTGTTRTDPPAEACTMPATYTASGDVSARGHGFSADTPLYESAYRYDGADRLTVRDFQGNFSQWR